MTVICSIDDFNSYTTSDASYAGIFCGRCGSKMYLSQDGSNRRCPNCDDK